MEDLSIRLVIADDHQLMLDGLRAMLSESEKVEIVGTAKNGKELLELLDNTPADVIMLDINMPQMDGIQATSQIKEKFPETKILIVSTHDDTRLVKEIYKLGAKGYVLKTAGQQTLIDAVHAIAKGKTYFSPEIQNKLTEAFLEGQQKENPNEAMLPISLTRREKEILKLIAMEYTGKEIASELHISINTVETHRKNLLRKLKAKNTAGLVKYAMKHDLI